MCDDDEQEAQPDKYYPDGTPILDDELMTATMKWALLFEQRDGERLVGQTRTLYGEKLSTVWLGLDHNWSETGPPLIFETMLFAPADHYGDRKYIAEHYPHDQLLLRYGTLAEAQAMHRRLRWHCVVPPTWRAYLLGELAGIDLWKEG